ncbi:MAG: hypothetical protein WCX13_03295 [Candidatus Hydrogenedentales bacterium]
MPGYPECPRWAFPSVSCILMAMGSIAAERSGINLYSEYSLHAQLKDYLAKPEDRLEALVEGKVVDLVRADGELVEVQTGHLGQLAPKVLEFAGKGYRVRVIYPVSARRELRRLDPVTNELLSVRMSPKRGDLYSLFDELIRAPGFVAARNVTVEILMVRSAETKIRDGSGSWWRKGDRTVDKELLEVLSSRSFRTRGQWLALIPKSLASPFTSAALGEAIGIHPQRARKILYCFCHAGLLAESGKHGRYKTYEKLSRVGRSDLT